MEERFRIVRKQLDDLGYLQVLVPDSLLLCEALLKDLIQTTESLLKYKELAHESAKERDRLQMGAEPYKCDNAKLVKECNELHASYLKYQDHSEKLQDDLKCRLSTLEKRKLDADFECERLRERVRRLELETAKKTLTFGDRKNIVKDGRKSVTSILKGGDAMPLEQKCKEIRQLKEDQSRLSEMNESLHRQLNNRDREIDRLSRMLEGGRPMEALNKDCCYKDFDGKFYKMQNEICGIQKDKCDLELRLKDAVTKQHEAMERALYLAEKNRQLEGELHSIDKMALAVESDCNARVKDNTQKVFRLEERVHDTVLQLQGLEREVTELKREKQGMLTDIDSFKVEKKQLQAVLETALEEKKRLNDKLNQLSVIEHDLNMEIDRLVQTSALQKRKISELECKAFAGKFESSTNTASAEITERLRSERDHYMNEYYKLIETKSNGPNKSDIVALQQKLSEKDQLVSTLQHDNKSLAQEKHNLMIRIEKLSERDIDEYHPVSAKASVRRLERERDLLKADVLRLEEERDAIRQRLRATVESQVGEQSKLQDNLKEAEDRIDQLEKERRELVHTQGSRRATIFNLEEQCQTLSDQLKLSQSEANQQRALFVQLKTLHEQTDKALADALAQVEQLEGQLSSSKRQIDGLENASERHSDSTNVLRNEVALLKENLAKIDEEKDNLLIVVDEKTERLAALERELLLKDNKIEALNKAATDLKTRLNMTNDNQAAKEQLLRSASIESAALRQEIEALARSKDGAVQENRYLQDELASSTAQCKCTQTELEAVKRQVEDLKRQLQHYVSEVKLFEDLMSQKEVERTELLEQFKSLSQEASFLENNNHTLENEATQSKVQLSVTLDHVQDLEQRLSAQDDIINGYAKKLTDSATRVADVDMQLAHYKQLQECSSADAASLRELCMRLDKQKETLLQDLRLKDEEQANLNRDVTRLQVECETLKASLAKDRNSIENMEQLLGESRQEAVKLKIINGSLEVEVRKSKQKLDELQKGNAATTTFTYSAQVAQTAAADRRTCPTHDFGEIIDTTSACPYCRRECPRHPSQFLHETTGVDEGRYGRPSNAEGGPMRGFERPSIVKSAEGYEQKCVNRNSFVYDK